MKSVWLGAALAVAACCSASAAPKPKPVATAAWAIAPAEAACQTDIELTGRSGAILDVTLESDGAQIALRFARGAVPERAFLPIRIDGRPFANLVQATSDPKTAIMILSDETLTAMRKGTNLQIAWLAAELVGAPLAGSDQGLIDLRTCGAQVAGLARARMANAQLAEARARADAQAQAVAAEQLATAKAQNAAAQAEQRRLSAEADRAAAEADRQRALAQADRRRETQEMQARQTHADAAYDNDYDYPQRYPLYAQPAPWRDYRNPYDR